MQSLNKPFFVTFEGVDCCGKTTMIEELQYYCSDHEFKFVIQAEKFTDPVKNKIFETAKFPSPQLQLLYWWIARRKIIENFYNGSNDILILDRYYDSTYVYQNLKGDIIAVPMNFNEYLFPIPDLTFYLKAPVNVIIDRLTTVRKKTEYVDPYEKLNNINNYILKYNYLYDKEPDRPKDKYHKVKIIDATQPINSVKREILQIFETSYADYIKFKNGDN